MINKFKNRPNVENITYIYILYYHSNIHFQFSSSLAVFPILNIKSDITEVLEYSQNAKFPRLKSRRYVFNSHKRQ